MSLQLIYFFFILFSQNPSQNGVIEGQLVDFTTQEPIGDGIIVLFGSSKGIMTDKKGHFKLRNLALDRCEIILSDDREKYKYHIISNIFLTKVFNKIDLGKISMIKKSDDFKLLTSTCYEVEGYSYPIEQKDGHYRFIEEDVVFIDLDNPAECK